MNIYKELKKPIFSLAPMEEVTDTVFRQIIMSIARPDLFYTEFVNVEGLTSKGRDSVIHRLKYESKEKPIIAQLWGVTPEKFFEASRIVFDLGFDGIDINMGCSVKKVAVTGAGSGLIMGDRELVGDIIAAVKDGSHGLPVSVKTRIGWDTPDINGWIGFLLKQDLEVLTIHGRTARGEYSIKADWKYIKESVDLRNYLEKDTMIFGNGDISSLSQAKEFAEKYNVDGVMIGRSVISNPWFFLGEKDITTSEKISMFEKHVNLFSNVWVDSKNFHSLKKFFRSYINNFEGANEIRAELMECNSIDELQRKVELLIK